MKYLIKLIYKFHRESVLNMVVEDFYKDIPKKISEPAISILEEDRKTIDNWVVYQAYILQRKIPTSRKSVDTIFGMLLQLRLIQHLISNGRILTKEAEGTKSISELTSRKDIDNRLEKALKGVNEFKKKLNIHS